MRRVPLGLNLRRLTSPQKSLSKLLSKRAYGGRHAGVSVAREVFPAGCANGEFDLPPTHDIVIRSGNGCELQTEDGAKMVDFSMGWGSALVGHSNPEVVAAVSAQIGHGSNFAFINSQSLRLGARVVEASECMDQMRYCASGTEATMYCMRLAKANTGRHKVLKFEGAYHGANDEGVSSLFPKSETPFPTPELTSSGVPHIKDTLLVAPFNDFDLTERIIGAHCRELAAVIVEPLHRCTPPTEGFLSFLRDCCNRHGIVLIFDEVVTGFRLAFGGAQEYYGVSPDLVAYGKALGGGYPIGVFGGKRELMMQTEEFRLANIDAMNAYVWTASSLGGNPISCAAANATLDVLSEGKAPDGDDWYKHLHATGKQFREGLRRVVSGSPLEGRVSVSGDGPLAQLLFCDRVTTSYREQKRNEDSATRRKVMLDLFKSGVFLNPMGTKLYISIAHRQEHFDYFYSKLKTVLDNCV